MAAAQEITGNADTALASELQNGASNITAVAGVLDKEKLVEMVKGFFNEDPSVRMNALEAMDSPILAPAKKDLAPIYEKLNNEFGR